MKKTNKEIILVTRGTGEEIQSIEYLKPEQYWEKAENEDTEEGDAWETVRILKEGTEYDGNFIFPQAPKPPEPDESFQQQALIRDLFVQCVKQMKAETVAKLIAELSPLESADIVNNLEPEKQIEVIRLIATQERIKSEACREIIEAVEKLLEGLAETEYVSTDGVQKAAGILNMIDKASKEQIMSLLEKDNPELAEKLKHSLIAFEDVVYLDDPSLQRVMREIDQQDLSKALKGVNAVVQNKFFQNMSKRAAAMLKEDMEFMGPTRMRDVEDAQHKIVAVIMHLIDTGEIVTAGQGEDAVVS
jgi:flagellar motor switch protein FliG